MRTIYKIIFEVYKNFKLIFRNWSSLVLIILAPLLLILLVGYSFSGDNLHDIHIGIIVQNNNVNFDDFANNVSNFADLRGYTSINDCVSDLILEKVHICLDIKGSFITDSEGIPTGEINFYYDNTKQQMSLALLSQIKEYFGLTSEKISLISTQKIFDNIVSLLNFINARIDDIDVVQERSENIREDLINRKQELIDVRDDFYPKYVLIKSTQETFNRYFNQFNANADSLFVSLDSLDNTIDDVNELLELPEYNLSFDIMRDKLSELKIGINDMKESTNSTLIELRKISDSLNSVVAEMDNVNDLLNDEINRTDYYLQLINESVVQINMISSEAKDKMKDLSALDPSLAAKIAKPITQSFEALVQDVKRIQLTFPVLLTTIIVFICLLFSNIITLLEINSKAYTRNILAPVNDIIFVIGLGITNLIIISFQVIILFIVAQTKFNINIVSHLSTIIPITLVLTLMFIFLGMIIAYMSKNIQTSILISTFLALAFFLFSNALNALESMPRFAANIAVMNPVVIVNSMYRLIFFFGVELSEMSSSFAVLLLYMFIAAAALVFVSKKKNKQRF